MKEYEFTLKFALSDAEADTDQLVEKLYAAGCDDALVGTGVPGRVALQFSREAATAAEAMLSSIRDVKQAAPEARLIEASPDLVGLSDIADFFGFTRQNMRKLMLMLTHRASFPLPLHEGSTAIWHLADVLVWFRQFQNRAVDAAMVEMASTTMRLNISRQFGESAGELSTLLLSDEGWNAARETLLHMVATQASAK